MSIIETTNHSRNSISPELKLVAVLSLPMLNEQQIQTANSLIKLIDNEHFTALVKHHRVWPCVYRNVRNYYSQNFSEATLNFLEFKHYQNVKQTKKQFNTCGELLRHFKEKEVNIRVLKGFPLAFKLYGDVSKRHSSDIDLVVHKTDFEAANSVLISKGFNCEQFENLTAKQRSIYFSAHKDITYYNEAGTMVELHLRLSVFSIKVTDHYLEVLFKQTTPTESKTAELLYLCWHGSHTLFHRLKWLTDIAIYLGQLKGEDHEELIYLAQKTGAMRLLCLSWILSNKLFETPVPNKISMFYQQDMATRILVSISLKQLIKPKTANSLRFKIERFVCEAFLYQNWSEKLISIQQKFQPTLLDFKTAPIIPRQLFFIYYPLRPLLFLYRRILSTQIFTTKEK